MCVHTRTRAKSRDMPCHSVDVCTKRARAHARTFTHVRRYAHRCIDKDRHAHTDGYTDICIHTYEYTN